MRSGQYFGEVFPLSRAAPNSIEEATHDASERSENYSG